MRNSRSNAHLKREKPNARDANGLSQSGRSVDRPTVYSKSYTVVLAMSLTALMCLTPSPAAELGRAGIPSGLLVTVIRAEQRCFKDTLETAGRIVPREQILVRPETEGLRVSQVLVEDGDRVDEGQVLARLSRGDAKSGSLPAAATIKAPAAGVISYRTAQVHSPATVRGEALFRLIVGGELELQAEILPPKLSKLAPGQPATIEIPGRDEIIAGYVRSVSPITNERTQTASARIFIGDQKLPIGAFAKAVVVVGESCGPSVPLSAIVYGADGAIIQVLRDNRIETRLVNVGVLSDGNVEIGEGLKAGEIVVQRSGAFLRDGDLVRSLVVQGAP